MNRLTRLMHPLRDRIDALPPAGVRAAWMAAVVLAGVVSWLAFSAWRAGDALRERAEQVAALLDPYPADRADADADGEPVAAVTRLRERRFFSPAPPQDFRNARGVLGDRVLYPGGQSFAVGEHAMGATVKEIGLNYVELEFEGETVRVEFGGGGGGGFEGPRRGGGRGMRRGRGGGGGGGGYGGYGQ